MKIQAFMGYIICLFAVSFEHDNEILHGEKIQKFNVEIYAKAL